MLINHLRDGALQRDDILVKRLDITDKLDTVHQKDGDLNMLLTQGVQEFGL